MLWQEFHFPKTALVTAHAADKALHEGAMVSWGHGDATAGGGREYYMAGSCLHSRISHKTGVSKHPICFHFHTWWHMVRCHNRFIVWSTTRTGHALTVESVAETGDHRKTQWLKESIVQTKQKILSTAFVQTVDTKIYLHISFHTSCVYWQATPPSENRDGGCLFPCVLAALPLFQGQGKQTRKFVRAQWPQHWIELIKDNLLRQEQNETESGTELVLTDHGSW